MVSRVTMMFNLNEIFSLSLSRFLTDNFKVACGFPCLSGGGSLWKTRCPGLVLCDNVINKNYKTSEGAAFVLIVQRDSLFKLSIYFSWQNIFRSVPEICSPLF